MGSDRPENFPKQGLLTSINLALESFQDGLNFPSGGSSPSLAPALFLPEGQVNNASRNTGKTVSAFEGSVKE